MDVTNSVDISLLIEKLKDRLAQNCGRYRLQFPNYGIGQQYLLKDNSNWLAAFWPGLLWLCAADERDTAIDGRFAPMATSLLPSFVTRLDKRVHITHDLGFLYTLSARAQWDVIQDAHARSLALRAADDLYKRYRLPGKYIQAWGAVGDEHEGGRMIADTMMNLPLLFWTSEQTGDDRYYVAAYNHAINTEKHLVRPDGSTYHTFFFHQDTGEPDRPETHQGISDESLWARGQAWVIYGMALAAHWCDSSLFLETAQKTAARFLAELPDYKIPYWDLRLPTTETHLRDSSAAAIAACGLLRIAKLSQNDLYQRQAEELLQALLDHCLETDPDAEGLLKHGALHIPKGWAPDDYLIFGDYFFLEALLTLENKNPDFWGPSR